MAIYSNISDDDGTLDLEGENLEELAAQLPADWRGTARARDTRGFVVGFIGRDARGVATWRYA